MIARMWETRIREGQLDEFCTWTKTTAWPQFLAAPGFGGGELYRSDVQDRAVIVTRWASTRGFGRRQRMVRPRRGALRRPRAGSVGVHPRRPGVDKGTRGRSTFLVLTCADCGATNPAGHRFCSSCGSPLAAACPECGTPAGPGQRFCGSCGTALTAGRGRRVLRGVEYAGLVRPGSGRVAERRVCSVLFCDLVGFTPCRRLATPKRFASCCRGTSTPRAR